MNYLINQVTFGRGNLLMQGRRRLLWVILFLCIKSVGSAQVLPGTEMVEMVMLAESYRTAKNLSFNVHITYTDSANVDSIVEEMTAIYKLHGNLYYTYIDSTEIVQGSRYSLKVNHYDSLISVFDRQEYPDVLNMPITDTLYWRTFTQSISVVDSGSAGGGGFAPMAIVNPIRTLKIVFKPGAQFSSYEVQYYKDLYQITKVKCYMPAQDVMEDDIFPSGKAVITFTFSDYNTDPLVNDWFNEEKFISVVEGQFVPKPAYTGYSIEKHITQ